MTNQIATDETKTKFTDFLTALDGLTQPTWTVTELATDPKFGNGFSRPTIYMFCKKLQRDGYICQVQRGTYKKVRPEIHLVAELRAGHITTDRIWGSRSVPKPVQAKTAPQAAPEPTAPTDTPLTAALSTLSALPEAIATVVSSLLDAHFSECQTLTEMLQTRIERLENLTSLLRIKDLDIASQRAKIDDLTTRLAKLQVEKNRVVVEEKVLIRDRPGVQYGNGR